MKLTKAMRAAITNRIINKARPVREANLRGREHALAVRLIRHRYGADGFELCRALPEGWLQVFKHIAFDYTLTQVLPRKSRVIGTGRCRREVVYPRQAIELAEYVPLPMSVRDGWTREEVGEKLVDEVTALFNAKIELEDDIALLEQQITATLASFNTVERLSADWPEGYAELPAEMLKPAVEGLPAPRIADLNARITAVKEAA